MLTHLAKMGKCVIIYWHMLETDPVEAAKSICLNKLGNWPNNFIYSYIVC